MGEDRRLPVQRASPTAGGRSTADRRKRYAFVKAAQAVALAAAAFVLLRVVAPWLVDLHSTPALVLAILLLVAGAFGVCWFAWNLATSFRHRGDDDA